MDESLTTTEKQKRVALIEAKLNGVWKDGTAISATMDKDGNPIFADQIRGARKGAYENIAKSEEKDRKKLEEASKKSLSGLMDIVSNREDYKSEEEWNKAMKDLVKTSTWNSEYHIEAQQLILSANNSDISVVENDPFITAFDDEMYANWQKLSDQGYYDSLRLKLRKADGFQMNQNSVSQRMSILRSMREQAIALKEAKKNAAAGSSKVSTDWKGSTYMTMGEKYISYDPRLVGAPGSKQAKMKNRALQMFWSEAPFLKEGLPNDKFAETIIQRTMKEFDPKNQWITKDENGVIQVVPEYDTYWEIDKAKRKGTITVSQATELQKAVTERDKQLLALERSRNNKKK